MFNRRRSSSFSATVLTLLLALADGQTQEPSPDARTTAQLIANLNDLERGNQKAREAIRSAASTKNLEVITVGLASSDYDVRGESLAALKNFSPTERRSALAATLSNAAIWQAKIGGEAATIQTVYLWDFADALKPFGLNINSRDLLNQTSRSAIAQMLNTAKLPQR
jgi:hypothetical protein